MLTSNSNPIVAKEDFELMTLLSPPPRVSGVCASTPSLQGAEDQIQSSHQHSDNQRHKKWISSSHCPTNIQSVAALALSGGSAPLSGSRFRLVAQADRRGSGCHEDPAGSI